MHASNLDAKSGNAQEERKGKSAMAASPPAENRIGDHKFTGGARRVAAIKSRGRTRGRTRAEGTNGSANVRERGRGNITAASRRTAAALYVGGVGVRVRAAAVLCAVACGVA